MFHWNSYFYHRWLASKGKYKELRKVLTRYAESKGKTLDDEILQKIEQHAEETVV